MVTESWFGSLWRIPRKNASEPEKLAIGVLAFEVASLMSKVVHLWQSLSDKDIVRSREEIMNSDGVRRLVSDDQDFLVGLVCAEIIENLSLVSRSVARLGKKCTDPNLQRFEYVFDDLIQSNADPYGWEYALKKMERKVKKMGRFITGCANLYQELEVLAELEQNLRRMKGSNVPSRGTLREFHQKVIWQRQEVKNLQEISLWNRTYDYTVRLLARSVFTTFGRIKHVFGINQMEAVVGIYDSKTINYPDYLPRSQSIPALTHSSVYPSEINLARFSSGPIERPITKSGPISVANKTQTRDHSSMSLHMKHQHSKSKRLAHGVSFKGCIVGGSDSPAPHSCISISRGYPSSNGVLSGALNADPLAHVDVLRSNLSLFSSKHRLLNAPASTLGAAALALHYANVIIIIERLVVSPHLISPDARDDLYNMLPTSLRVALRARLKSYVKNSGSSVYETDLGAEWSEALAKILEWLSPLAHNMIKWQSERNLEQQPLISRTNVLLVQTLYFADQVKTETAITELLVGLNYLWRLGRELNAKALLECTSGRVFDDYLDLRR